MGTHEQLQLGAMIQPLSKTKKLHLTKMETDKVIRCIKCWTFMSPLTILIENGCRFICNICDFTNILPIESSQALRQYEDQNEIQNISELKNVSNNFISDGYHLTQ